MSETSRNKFISQCVAHSPCVGKNDIHCKMNDSGTACVTCKRTLAEMLGWEMEMSFEDREKICKELLDR
jgi:predicted Fe-S protein YdhL (DUF1289 family)